MISSANADRIDDYWTLSESETLSVIEKPLRMGTAHIVTTWEVRQYVSSSGVAQMDCAPCTSQ
eukprot:IDg16783t1